MVKLIETLSYTAPGEKLSKVDAYVNNGKAYNVRVESTTTDEQAALTAAQWSDVRMKRDMLLQETDWRASSDLTLSEDWKTYRQAQEMCQHNLIHLILHGRQKPSS